MEHKVKILFLSSQDLPYRGHALSMYREMSKDHFEAKYVVFRKKYTSDNDFEYFYDIHNLFDRVCLKFRDYKRRWIENKRYGKYIEPIKSDPYCFNYCENYDITASAVLKKVNGFVPDIIALSWIRMSFSPKTVFDLHRITGAKLLFIMCDQAHVSGGCHFHLDCDKYLSGCYNCPAVNVQSIASETMSQMLHYYPTLSKYVVGKAPDCKIAMKSPLYKNTIFIPWVEYFYHEKIDKLKSRRKFGISSGDFVLMMGASDATEYRKGLVYAINAANFLSNNHSNITLLVLGRIKTDITVKISSKVKVIAPGYLSFDDMLCAYCASDCYMNTTIADSGPMMVNFSVGLGIPVVTFDVGIAQNLVKHKKNGYVAKFMDMEDFSQGCEYIFDLSKDEREKYSKEGLAIMSEYANQETWQERLYTMECKRLQK